jgi:hypothetical protein
VVTCCVEFAARVLANVETSLPAEQGKVKDPVAQMDRAVASYPQVASSSLAGVTTWTSTEVCLFQKIRIDITLVLSHPCDGYEAML